MALNYEEQYFNFLKLKREKPSFEFLARLIKSHLASVPYENISKLIRSKEVGASIPSFDEFVAQLTERHFGGTCFAQNIHLNHLLKYLGFDSRLVGIRRSELLSHVSLRVRLGGANYLVDVGIMSPIAGPYRIHPDASFDTWVGNQRFIYKPSHDEENYILEIHRDGKMIRVFNSSSEPVSQVELSMGIRETFESGAMFMTTLCVHRAFPSHSVGIWNCQLYRLEGAFRVKRELSSLEELKTAFSKDLSLPDYPLDKALELLRQNGAAQLFGD